LAALCQFQRLINLHDEKKTNIANFIFIILLQLKLISKSEKHPYEKWRHINLIVNRHQWQHSTAGANAND